MISTGLVRAVPPETINFLSNTENKVSEDGILPDEDLDVLPCARYVVANWQSVLTSFAQLAPDTRRQRLVVVAAEFLPPRDYVSFVSGIADLQTTGNATLQTIKTVAIAKMFKNGFLAYNFDKPEVVGLIAKLETILQAGEPGTWTAFFTAMKAGTLKQAIVAERTRDGNPMPEALADGPSEAYRQLMGNQ